LNRKLWIVNIALAAVALYAGVQLRKEYLAAQDREARVHKLVTPTPAPPYAKAPVEAPVTATAYADIAQKMLFDKSRNPTVVLELPPAPPPKPMPALPVYHGLMNLGGTRAILSLSKEAPQQFVRPGEPIGQFKLVDVNSEEMTLEWDGQTIHKKVDELTAPAAAPESAAARTDVPSAPTPPPPAAKSGPGTDLPQGGKTCAMNDGNAEGSVVEGYKKVVYSGPFGPSCIWQPASK
jgi:hypothetical protein